MEDWILDERPGYLGKYRNEFYARWNNLYGRDNWRLVWKFGEGLVDFIGACAIYEDAYFEFLKQNPKVLKQLVDEAADVFDDAPSNTNSYLDYNLQETERTHIQDIAIRRCVVRRGLRFKGHELIQIRDKEGNHPLSMILSPGRVPFHKPALIETPELEGWWQPGSVEAFYQSNKYLQVWTIKM